MKPGLYFFVLLLAAANVILVIALCLVTRSNQQLQVRLQAQQQALSQGILGQQAQQISAGVLQDLAGAAVNNPAHRQLLEKYGYRVPAAGQPAAPETPARSTSPSDPPAALGVQRLRAGADRQRPRAGNAAPEDTGKEQRAPLNPEQRTPDE